VADVYQSEKFARKLIKKGDDPLDVRDISFVNYYTRENGYYNRMNAELRKANRQAAKPYFGFAKGLLNALYKLPRGKKWTLYRAIKMAFSDLGYEEDEEYNWWQFNSCTTNPKVSVRMHVYCNK
jgi:hypothetical protein